MCPLLDTRYRRFETTLQRVLREDGRRQDWLVERLRAKGIRADASSVSRWARGVHVPEEATRAAIADVLDRQVEELWPRLGESEAA